MERTILVLSERFLEMESHKQSFARKIWLKTKKRFSAGRSFPKSSGFTDLKRRLHTRPVQCRHIKVTCITSLFRQQTTRMRENKM